MKTTSIYASLLLLFNESLFLLKNQFFLSNCEILYSYVNVQNNARGQTPKNIETEIITNIIIKFT